MIDFWTEKGVVPYDTFFLWSRQGVKDYDRGCRRYSLIHESLLRDSPAQIG